MITAHPLLPFPFLSLPSLSSLLFFPPSLPAFSHEDTNRHPLRNRNQHRCFSEHLRLIISRSLSLSSFACACGEMRLWSGQASGKKRVLGGSSKNKERNCQQKKKKGQQFVKVFLFFLFFRSLCNTTEEINVQSGRSEERGRESRRDG
jgi:hypothetical protein